MNRERELQQKSGRNNHKTESRGPDGICCVYYKKRRRTEKGASRRQRKMQREIRKEEDDGHWGHNGDGRNGLRK